MSTDKRENKVTIPRATGLLVIVVENSNPNGDPDQESDPRRRSHDNRGMITGVSFKRKLRDLVLRKDEPVWKKVAAELNIQEEGGTWKHHEIEFDLLERRDINRGEVNEQLNNHFEGFKNKFWDARTFGNTFLEQGVGDTIRAGVAHFGWLFQFLPSEYIGSRRRS
jgi:CRISPR-associated protein Csd2